MHRKAAVFLAACACVWTNAYPQADKTIASTSLCGDGYLLALLGETEPERIAALSWQSRDALSLAPDNLKSLPQAWDSPERLLSLPVDHIVFGPGEGFSSETYLARNGTGISRITWGEDFETVRSNFKMLGENAGLAQTARRLSANMADRLAALDSANGPKPVKILYLSRSGGSAGPGTYVDAAITAAGGENIMTKPGWLTPDPEYLISLKPDLILTSFFKGGYESVNAVPLRHKAVRDFIARHERLDIPGNLWPCAGPNLIDTAEIIHAKIKALP